VIKKIIDLLAAMRGVFDLIKMVLLVVIIWKATAFATLIVGNLNTINDNLGSAVSRVKSVGDGLASDEFRDKADGATDAVIGVKERFTEKWKGLSK